MPKALGFIRMGHISEFPDASLVRRDERPQPNDAKQPAAAASRMIACAWSGCAASYDCFKGQPEGWNNLLTFREEQKVFCSAKLNRENGIRDAVLCPQHVAELNKRLVQP
jgi:hypothetical protein